MPLRPSCGVVVKSVGTELMQTDFEYFTDAVSIYKTQITDLTNKIRT